MIDSLNGNNNNKSPGKGKKNSKSKRQKAKEANNGQNSATAGAADTGKENSGNMVCMKKKELFSKNSNL